MSTTSKEINTRIKLKRDTESTWVEKNPVILNGEVALVDGADGRLRAKIGGDNTNYNDLEFLDNIHIMTAENKDDPIPSNAVIVIDTTENAGDIGTGSGTVIDGSAYMPKFAVTADDNGKVLGVVNGTWAVMTIQTSSSGTGAGTPGENGQDGFSPIVAVETIEGGHRVTITDANDPPKQFDVMDGTIGKDGNDGQPGKSAYEIALELNPNIGSESEWIASLKGEDGQDGITPVRGEHYWTDADKSEIKAYVDAAIIGGEW